MTALFPLLLLFALPLIGLEEGLSPLQGFCQKPNQQLNQQLIPRLEASKEVFYNSIQETSVSEHLAFYHLFPDSKEGKEALKQAFKLLNPELKGDLPFQELPLFFHTPSLFNPNPRPLSEKTIDLIETLSQSLKNRQLKGHAAKTEEEVLALAPEEIDLARALLIAQFGPFKNHAAEIRSYEAMIDLLALEIRASLSSNDPKEIVEAINQQIFFKRHFRFPPKSIYSEQIDRFTFLSSVLDARQGVCLGVSLLYLAIAERLGLPLFAITPPGHIYLSCHPSLNIETTLRGVHIPSDHYLSLNTYALQTRDKKQVIGLAFINQASIYWQQDALKEASAAYERAAPYLPGDPLLKELTAFCHIAQGERAIEILRPLQGQKVYGEVQQNRLVRDLLEGYADGDGIKLIFAHIQPEESSLLQKKEELEQYLISHPKFCSGLFQLATCWLELNRPNEALKALLAYHQIDPSDPSVEYYLSLLFIDQGRYRKAWHHLKLAESLVTTYRPPALKALRQNLLALYPKGNF
ncbi:MAG: hypothetical protein K0S07_889 [Chlamydiales bacterium]|jgi:regulator of sirC expression with transglutaminase-like and TPR domain|nr:hypothetical protein [Chlamydiales bacterium]